MSATCFAVSGPTPRNEATACFLCGDASRERTASHQVPSRPPAGPRALLSSLQRSFNPFCMDIRNRLGDVAIEPGPLHRHGVHGYGSSCYYPIQVVSSWDARTTVSCTNGFSSSTYVNPSFRRCQPRRIFLLILSALMPRFCLWMLAETP